MVAQQFIWKHELPQDYLSQVADFIVRNAGADAVGRAPLAGSDPLTGGSRYIPSGTGAPAASASSSSSLAVDPLSGGGAYRSQAASAPRNFPQTAILVFDTGNVPAMSKKLTGLNDTARETGRTQVNPSVLEALLAAVSNLNSGQSVTAEQLEVVRTMLTWREEDMIPVLDLARFVVRLPGGHGLVTDATTGPDVMRRVVGFTAPQHAGPTRMLALRLLSNCFLSPAKQLITSSVVDVVNTIGRAQSIPTGQPRTAFVSLLTNLAVCVSELEFESKAALVAELVNALGNEQDPTLQRLLCVAIGTVVTLDAMFKESLGADPSMMVRLEMLSQSTDDSTRNCVLELKRVLTGQ